MQLINIFYKGFRLLLCVIDIFRKNAWLNPLKDKKGTTIINGFQKILNESDNKPNKIWVDKGSEFYNRSMKSCLEKNDIEMYLAHNEAKTCFAERFIGILKNKIYKYMTSVTKNVYIDKLDGIINIYNNTYRSTIKMKPADVKSNTYISSSKKVIIKILNLKLVILLKYQNIKIFLQKVTLQIGLKKFLWLKKLKALYCGHMLFVIVMETKLLERFTKKICEEQIKKSLELKK